MATALEILHEGTVIPAIPLVLDEKRCYNKEKQRRLIRYYLETGVGGIAIAVHTTQFAIRDKGIDLLEPLLATAQEEIDAYCAETGKVIVRVSGVCGEWQQAVAEAELAKQYGFTAVLVSPGGLSHLSEEALLQRTERIAAVMPVIGFYLQNSVGGKRLSFDYWRQLADIDNVVAVKSAPFNRYQTLDLVRGVAFSRRREQVTLYTGNDDNIVIDLLTKYRFVVDGKPVELGFRGGLLGHWSAWTKKAVELFALTSRYRDAAEIPAELLTLAAQVTDSNGALFDVNNDFASLLCHYH